MLKGDFYRVTSLQHESRAVKADVEINVASPIFKGHFPGQPVIPGACMLQIIKETVQQALQRSIRLQKASNLKFIVPINPTSDNILHLTLSIEPTEPIFRVTGSILQQESACFKFQGEFAFI